MYDTVKPNCNYLASISSKVSSYHDRKTINYGWAKRNGAIKYVSPAGSPFCTCLDIPCGSKCLGYILYQCVKSLISFLKASPIVSSKIVVSLWKRLYNHNNFFQVIYCVFFCLHDDDLFFANIYLRCSL